MRRLLWHDLEIWKSRDNRKPLVLRGVRQCGKTWLIKEFGVKNYVSCAYFNFEGNPQLHAVFEEDLNPNRILRELEVYQNARINPEDTLIVFDEIQFCNKALTSLKYFNENRPDLSIIAAGSLLGIALSKPLSFPVGKVDFLDLYPMSFPEFLLACDDDLLLQTLDEHTLGKSMPASMHPRLIEQLYNYYFVGGMPEAVYAWINRHDPNDVTRIHNNILDSYELDFAKHAPDREFEKLSAIWHAIPAQLAKENQKFIFSHIKSGYRSRDLESSLQWLISAGLVHKVTKIEKPGIPLAGYADDRYFKLYLCDVGLMRAMAGIPLLSIKQRDPAFSEFWGALTENFVLTEMIAKHLKPFFWRSKQSAEVDFVYHLGNRIIPLEVKSENRVRSRSLSVYMEKYKPDIAVRLSMKNAGAEQPLYSMPLYLAYKLSDINE